MIEEVAHQAGLLERAHGPTDRIEHESLAGCRAVVKLEDDHGDQLPAQRLQGAKALHAVDELQPQTGRADHERQA